MSDSNVFSIRLSNTAGGWEITVTYDLRSSYSFSAIRGGEQRAETNIRSIGKLIDSLTGLADLSESENEALHKAYLERIPERDIRQQIDFTLGKYHWLSLHVDFGPFAEVSNNDVLKVFALNARYGLVMETGDDLWVDDVDFRRYAVVFHELIHLQQDMTTGLGAWDWIYMAPEKLFELRRSSDTVGAEPKEVRESLQIYGGRNSTSPNRDLFVQSSLTRIVKDEHQFIFNFISIESILEAEAVSTTIFHLLASTFNEADQRHTELSRDAYDPSGKDPVYWVVLSLVRQIVKNTALHTNSMADQVVACLLTAFSCDLALAVPPPNLMGKLDLPYWHFDPRLSLARILARMTEVAQSRPNTIVSNLSPNRLDHLFAELATDVPPEHFMIHPASIYAGWFETLSRIRNPTAIDRLRADVMRVRAEDPFRFAVKSRDLTAIPFVGYNIGSRSRFMSLRPPIKPPPLSHKSLPQWVERFEAELVLETDEVRVIDRLIDHYRDKSPFRCVFVASQHCDAWTGRCLDGIETLADTPLAGCRVRASCEEAKLPLS